MVSRRKFLQQAGATVVAAANWDQRVYGANERVILGLIGGRNQGKAVARRAIQAGAVVKVLCDVDEAILQEVAPVLAEAQGRKPELVKDFRKVLEDRDVDAVIVATPDHWHTHITLLACQAGKDVYVEKPLSQTIREGQLIRDAARKYQRVVQVGTQRRSAEHFHQAADYVASGKLGKLCLIRAWMCQLRPSIGNPPDCDPPPTVDYDLWLGPAPKRPFNPNRFHYNWRFFWDYGNSELGNQGIHMLDVAMMAIERMRGLERNLPTRVTSSGGIYWLNDAKEVPDTQITTWDYGDFLLVWELRSFGRHHPLEGTEAGTAFYGTDGALVVDGKSWRVYDNQNRLVMEQPGSPYRHEANFLECVKNRKRPNADVEIGRRSTTLCHLGNIAYRLGRSVVFDPVAENFGTDEEANAWLTKHYRETYPLPRV